MGGEVPALSAMKRARHLRRNTEAFTLFEMIVVVAIFVLLAGGIYATVNAAVRATATLTEENAQVQRLEAFVSLVRKTFHNLPATARFSGTAGSPESGGAAEIVLREAPGVFAWGMGGPVKGTVLLAARPRLGGGREISLLTLPGTLSEMELREAVDRGAWLRLLPDLREVRWRFWDEAQQDWVDTWPEGNERPPLVELSLTMLGENIPRAYVFWLPPVREMATGQSVTPREGEQEPPPEENP